MAKHDEKTGELAPTETTETTKRFPLMLQYEEIIGARLEKVRDEDAVKTPTGILWMWTWTPEEAGMFLSQMDGVHYLLNRTIRELCFSTSPNGKQLMYEAFCPKELREKIDNVNKIYDEPVGTIPPIPKGDCEIDLRAGIPVGMRPTVYTINHWHFCGRVKGISKEVRMQLAHMHGMYITEGQRVTVGRDHENVELEAVR